MDKFNSRNKILIAAAILIIIISVIILKSANITTDNAVLKNIWLNIPFNELEWEYSNGEFISGPNPMNSLASISPQQTMFINNRKVFSIGKDNEVVLLRKFDNIVYSYSDENNYEILDPDGNIISVINGNVIKYNLSDINNFQITCWKIFNFNNEKLCLSNNAGEIYNLFPDVPAEINKSFNKEKFILKDFIAQGNNNLIMYESLPEVEENDIITPVIPQDTLSQNITPSKNNKVIISINGKESELKDIFIYSIVPQKDGYIINAMKRGDWLNKLENYVILKIDYKGTVTQLYNNANGIILW
jgi:hypothetical protein